MKHKIKWWGFLLHPTKSSQQVRTPIILRCSSDGLELISRLPLGPNAEHQQLQIDIKDSPVRGATGHVAH